MLMVRFTVSGIKGCINATAGVRRVDRRQVDELIAMLTAAELLEEQAVSLFQAIAGKYPDLKRSTVPRWGAHSPR